MCLGEGHFLVFLAHRSPEPGKSHLDQMGRTTWQPESLGFKLMQLVIKSFGLVMEVNVFHAWEDE